MHRHHTLAAKLLLACNLLLVDRPAHVTTYNLDGISVEEIYQILSRRKEFSKEMISAVKLSNHFKESIDDKEERPNSGSGKEKETGLMRPPLPRR